MTNTVSDCLYTGGVRIIPRHPMSQAGAVQGTRVHAGPDREDPDPVCIRAQIHLYSQRLKFLINMLALSID